MRWISPAAAVSSGGVEELLIKMAASFSKSGLFLKHVQHFHVPFAKKEHVESHALKAWISSSSFDVYFEEKMLESLV